MRVLALDPSSTCTGWAVLDGLERDELIDGGLIKPSASKFLDKAAPEAKHDDLLKWYSQGPLASSRRMIETLGDVLPLFDEYKPDRVAVEVPSGKAGTGSKWGAKGSLTTYGMAAGAVWAYCLAIQPGKTVAINERMWTVGQTSKQGRAYTHESLYPGRYRANIDPGGDLSDAIGIGRWYLRQRIERGDDG